MKKFWRWLLDVKEMTLWHPESPGMKNTVRRNRFQRCVYPKEFATLTESIKSR